MLACGPVDAVDARRMGLVHRIVPRKDLHAEAARVALKLADRDPSVLAAAKAAVRFGLDVPLDRGLEIEERLMARLAMSSPGRMGGSEKAASLRTEV